MPFAAHAESEGIGNPRAVVSLHEAGHLVAMALLLEDVSAEAVLLENRGFAYSRRPVRDMGCSFQIVTAAGPAAERLARGWKPPALAATHSQQAQVKADFNSFRASYPWLTNC